MSFSVQSIIEKYPVGFSDNLMDILLEIKQHQDYISASDISLLSLHLKIPTSRVYSVISFYSDFRFEPQMGKQIKVCTGASCFSKGSGTLLERISKEIETEQGTYSRDKSFHLAESACMGHCNNGPVIKIDKKLYASIKPDKYESVLNTLKNG